MLRLSLLCALLLAFGVGCVTTPRPEEKLLQLGNEYAKDGLLREAADTYKKALQQNPNNPIARRNLGIVLVKSGAYAAAISQFEKVIGPLDSDYDTNFYLAEAYRAENKYAEAIYRYQKALRKKENSLRSMKALAWSYYKIRYYDEAIQITRRMQSLAKDDPQVAVITARTLLKVRKSNQALKVIMQAQRSARPEALPYIQSVEGDIHLARGKYKEALEVYQEALKVQPLLAGSLYGVGKCLIALGDTEKGAHYLIRSVRIKPDLTDAYFALGEVYESKDPKRALAFYNRFRKLAGQDPEYLNKISSINEKISKLRSAERKNRGNRKG